RVSIIFMDYINKRRLKLLGHVSIIDPDDAETLDRLRLPDYRAKVERGFLIRAAAFDWNCPQHITERYTEAHIREVLEPYQQRIAELEAQLAAGSA
ncbi:MAG: pyridoxamine 5'-phosphate oxidase family protein, partial [Alphaproteobacteria bacterium]